MLAVQSVTLKKGVNMVYIPKIEVSNSYVSFQEWNSNRELSKTHIDTLVKDVSFPKKFPFVPITIDKSWRIIDGQHRFQAAKKLQLPIYYIVDTTACEDDIRHRNQQMKNWDVKDHIHFFADKNYSYKLLLEFMEEFAIGTHFLTIVIQNISGKFPVKFYNLLKEGKINIEPFKNDIKDFLSVYVPIIKECRSIYTKGKTRHLFTRPYISGFSKLYREEKEIFFKIVEKLTLFCDRLPNVRFCEDAYNNILKLKSAKKPREVF